MQKRVVCDTSCLILLHKIGEIDLLQKIFGQIIITEAVFIEYKRRIPAWIQVVNPTTNLHRVLQGLLDLGEATSISLATEYKEVLLIIDELKGRKVAKELGITISGTLGLLAIAKHKGIIHSVKPIIEKIKQTNFRVSDILIEKILQHANEI